MDVKTWLAGCKDQDIYEFYHDGPIVRGTIQKHSFKLPSYVEPTEIIIAYKQRNKLVLSKELDVDTLSIELSEQDTFKFKAGLEVSVQLKIETTDSLLVSDKFNIKVEDSVYDIPVAISKETYAIEVMTNKNKVYAQDFFDMVSGEDLNCKVSLDGYWKSFVPKVYFNDSYNHLCEAELIEGVCKIPDEIIAKPGLIHIGLYNENTRNTIWSNPIRLKAPVTYVPNKEDEEQDNETTLNITEN